MSKQDLEALVRQAIDKPAPVSGKFDINSQEFQDEYTDSMIKEAGLVWCCNCCQFIDDEHHNIAHVFARGLDEIREKTVLERLAGKTTE